MTQQQQQFHGGVLDTDIFRVSIHMLGQRPVWVLPRLNNASFPHDRLTDFVRFPIEKICRQMPEQYSGYQLFAKCDIQKVFNSSFMSIPEGTPFQMYYEVRTVHSLDLPPDPEVPFTEHTDPLVDPRYLAPPPDAFS